MMMGRSDIPTHNIPKVLGKQPVDLMVSVVCADTVVAVGKEVRFVAVVACECQPIQQHKRVLDVYIVYWRYDSNNKKKMYGLGLGLTHFHISMK